MDKLELMVFNVGHGLSVALVERPSPYITLIDLGADTGFTPLKYLRLKLHLQPDVLYITHPHADHLDDVETALDQNFRPVALYYQDYDWADVKRRERPQLGYKIDDFRELIRILPKKSYAGSGSLREWRFTPENAKKAFGETSYVNNSSLFLIYSWRDFKISIAGDQESSAMEGLLQSAEFVKQAAKTDILIPSHHGHKNGFPTGWVGKIGKPHITIISVQERDPSVDSRYSKTEFARGVNIGGVARNMLTTRADGNILVTMWYGTDGSPKWSFEFF